MNCPHFTWVEIYDFSANEARLACEANSAGDMVSAVVLNETAKLAFELARELQARQAYG